MKIILSQSLGSHKKGSTIDVNKRTAQLLARTGRAVYATAPQSNPKAARRNEAKASAPKAPEQVEQPAQADNPAQEHLGAMLKADLATMASNLGASLDGSETKADLINIIERRRRYSRRDMQAG